MLTGFVGTAVALAGPQFRTCFEPYDLRLTQNSTKVFLPYSGRSIKTVKSSIDRALFCVFALFLSVNALGQTQVPHTFQAGQPARAAEVNENFEAMASAIDAADGNSGVLDQNELTSIWSNSLNAHFDLVKIGNDLYSCGQHALFGCDQAISSNGTQFGGLIYRPRTASLEFFDSVSSIRIAAIPVDIGSGFGELRFVGAANLAAHRNRGQMLVNDCDNPTIGYVQQDRSPRGPLTPSTVMSNSGRVYVLDSFDSVEVDVTGTTYGVMNFIVHSDNTTPICTPGISDRTGIWQQYTYSFAVDAGEARFAGPFTYQGSSIGLLDRVEALETP